MLDVWRFQEKLFIWKKKLLKIIEIPKQSPFIDFDTMEFYRKKIYMLVVILYYKNVLILKIYCISIRKYLRDFYLLEDIFSRISDQRSSTLRLCPWIRKCDRACFSQSLYLKMIRFPLSQTIIIIKTIIIIINCLTLTQKRKVKNLGKPRRVPRWKTFCFLFEWHWTEINSANSDVFDFLFKS